MTLPTDIITLTAAKSFLNITNTNSDGELGEFVSAASSLIAARIGPVAGSPTFDEWYNGGGTQILLRHPPVQSVTSVTESWYGTTTFPLTAQVLDDGLPKGVYGYSVDAQSGILSRRANGLMIRFATGRLNVHVVYVAGFATIPSELQTACKLLVKDLWASRIGGTRRATVDNAARKEESDFPARVEAILTNYHIPGIG